MIVTLTARRLKPGAYDDFRAAVERIESEAPEQVLNRWTRVHITRDVTDSDVILMFGLFDGTVEELRVIQAQIGGEEARVRDFEPYIDEILLDGSYEVLEQYTP